MDKLRKKNDDISKIMIESEYNMLVRLKYENPFLESDKKKKLFRLIEIYLHFAEMLEMVKNLNEKVDNIKKIKETPVEEE